MAVRPTIQDSANVNEGYKLHLNRQGGRQYVFRGRTTDGTANVELFLDGQSGKRLVIPNDTTCFCRIDYAVYNITDLKHGGGGYYYAIKRGTSGNIAEVAAATASPAVVADATPNFTIVTPSIDTTNQSLLLRVTGTAAKTIYYEFLVTITTASDSELLFSGATA